MLPQVTDDVVELLARLPDQPIWFADALKLLTVDDLRELDAAGCIRVERWFSIAFDGEFAPGVEPPRHQDGPSFSPANPQAPGTPSWSAIAKQSEENGRDRFRIRVSEVGRAALARRTRLRQASVQAASVEPAPSTPVTTAPASPAHAALAHVEPAPAATTPEPNLEPSDSDNDVFLRAEKFPETVRDLLRNATRPKRASKRLRSRGSGKDKTYSVRDAIGNWPELRMTWNARDGLFNMPKSAGATVQQRAPA